MLNEFIYTPGQVQTATHQRAGSSSRPSTSRSTTWARTINLGQNHVANQPTFDANNSDDIIFGGWGGDWIHGGAGDDAISGAEAIGVGGTLRGTRSTSTPTATRSGLEYIDFAHPCNPGDVLHFGADTNPGTANNHNELRLGEFLLYDEYDPRRVILFNADGSVWKGATPPWARQFFLNNEAASGNWVTACIAVDNQGNCTGTITNQPSDGDDAIFGDLGNDWSVGGTGQDTIWAGWGNDLLQRARPAHQQQRPQRRPRRRQLQLPGPRLRRRRPGHPDRQHRRRPAHRLGGRVQQLPGAVLTVRDRHGQPPGGTAAAHVPVRAVPQPGR